MFDRQIDVFGDEHDIAPAHEGMRLFEPVKVMPGQTGMDVDVPINRSITSYLEMYASEGNWLAYKGMFVCCDDRPGNASASARLKWERIASTRTRYEHDRSIAHTTFHRVPVYAITQYVPEDTGLEHGPARA